VLDLLFTELELQATPSVKGPILVPMMRLHGVIFSVSGHLDKPSRRHGL
jgi:hypothetical protein